MPDRTYECDYVDCPRTVTVRENASLLTEEKQREAFEESGWKLGSDLYPTWCPSHNPKHSYDMPKPRPVADLSELFETRVAATEGEEVKLSARVWPSELKLIEHVAKAGDTVRLGAQTVFAVHSYEYDVDSVGTHGRHEVDVVFVAYGSRPQPEYSHETAS